jgi:thiamine-phosphate diphosphorylase
VSCAVLPRPIICLVTDRRRLVRARVHEDDLFEALVRQVRAAALAGVSLVQVRERDLGSAALHRLVSRCLSAIRDTSCRLVVNDRIDVVLASGADGVHLRADSCTAERARELVGERLLIGRSVHSVAEAASVARGGAADYLVFGTVWPTASKPEGHAAVGPAALAAAVRAAAPVPVLAIGGVLPERAGEVAAAGAAGLAAVGMFLPRDGPPTLAETVQRVQISFDSPAVMP